MNFQRPDSVRFHPVKGLECPTRTKRTVVVSRERAKELIEETEAEVVAWESAGFARACKHNKLPWAEMRMISDNCEPGQIADFKQSLKISIVSTNKHVLSLNHEQTSYLSLSVFTLIHLPAFSNFVICVTLIHAALKPYKQFKSVN